MTQHNDTGSPKPPLSKRDRIIIAVFSFLVLVYGYVRLTNNIALASVMIVLITLGLTYLALSYCIKKAVSSVQANGGSSLGGVKSEVAWRTLWFVPILLFTLGFFVSFLGQEEEAGTAIGVISALTLLPIIPTYLVLGITRSIRKRKNA